jgi:hypothetical protein
MAGTKMSEYVSVGDLYEALMAWRVKQARLLEIGRAYSHLVPDMKIKDLVRSDAASLVMKK